MLLHDFLAPVKVRMRNVIEHIVPVLAGGLERSLRSPAIAEKRIARIALVQ